MTIYAHAQPEQDSTYWERVAHTRWGAYTADIAKQAILKAHDLSGKPTTALEIGCDGGRWSKLLTDLGWKMICTDINEEALNKCKRRVPTADCILVDPGANRLPCISESVGLLLCMEVGPVIQADWFIDEAFRVVKSDQLIVGVFWNFLSFRGFYSHIRNQLCNSFDWYKIAYPFWRRKLLNKGFSMLYEEGYCWFPFGRSSNSIFVPFFTGLEKNLRLRKLITVSPWIVFIARKNLG